jgi:cell division protein FtsW
LLFGIVIGLIALGIVMVFSASSATAYSESHDTMHYLKRQIMWVAVGGIFAYAAYRVDYSKLKQIAPGFYFTVFGLLVITLKLGFEVGGGRRWLGFHSISFQPSEVAKIAFVLYAAAKFSSLKDQIRSFTSGVAVILGFAFLLAVPIMKEPDLGTASLIVFVALGMLFCAGARWAHLALVAGTMVPAALAYAWSSSYQRNRLLAFLNPWKDAQNTGYHIVQSLYALGSGGLIGVGLGASRQKFFYLPEAHTDFIFAVIGEELGLIGTLAILGLFAAFAIRGFMIAARAKNDRFGAMLAVGCTLLVIVQAFINIAVVTSSWPVTGVPLPFISFGGTSMIVNMVAAALILNVARRNA